MEDGVKIQRLFGNAHLEPGSLPETAEVFVSWSVMNDLAASAWQAVI